MNLCPHGFREENCPHCSTAVGIKPPIQLVKPAPREIPMPVPRKDQLLNRDSVNPDNPLHQATPGNHQLKQITRKFDLRQSVGRTQDSLFTQKREQLIKKIDEDAKLYSSDTSFELEDIKKQFTRKQ